MGRWKKLESKDTFLALPLPPSEVSESRSVVSNSLRPHGLSMEFSRPERWSGLPFPSPEDLPNPGTEPRSPTFRADSLLDEPRGKPKNTGVGSISLLQRIFPTQESNQVLPHCRQIPLKLKTKCSTLKTLVTLFSKCEVFKNNSVSSCL